MRRLLLAAAAALLLLPAVARAEGTIFGEVQRTGMWANTSSNSVAVWGSGSQPCRSEVTDRTYGRVWHDVPIPCNFQPDPGSDGEAIVRDQTGSGLTYEFWTMQWNWNVAGKPNGWSAGYVTTGPDGVQGSGVRFEPGLPRLGELAAGAIAHMVQVEVPVACTWPNTKAPAIRSDGGTDPNCIPYGQQWRLPADTDCTLPKSRAARMVCVAARDYGMVATDQTHDKVIIRLEEAKPGQPDPYYSVGGYFGCTGAQSPEYGLLADHARRVLAVPVGQAAAGQLTVCPLDELTAREREVLHWLAEGLTDAEIGARVFLTHATVKFHLTNVRRKLGVRNRVEAAVTYHVWAAA